MHSPSYILALFLPLEVLLDIIEDLVRTAAVKAVIELLNFFVLSETYLIPLLTKLIKTQNNYSLHSSIDIAIEFLPVVPAAFQSLLLSLMLKIHRSTNIFNRNKISSAVSGLCKLIPENEELRIFLNEFLQDDEDCVRIAGIDLLICMEKDVQNYSFILNDPS